MQHAVATRIDGDAEAQEARAERNVDGEVAAIWEFETRESEREHLSGWIAHQVSSNVVRAEDIAILVRNYADKVEAELAPAMAAAGLRLRNVARIVGDISVQDLLEEELTKLLLSFFDLGTSARNPESWERALSSYQFLEGVDPEDEVALEQLNGRLASFIRRLRETMSSADLGPEAAATIAELVLSFVGVPAVRRSFAADGRSKDFERVKEGFVLLLQECTSEADGWEAALAELRGVGQVPLMTVHKSKGLEFHTMIFFGLDNQSWWSLTPNKAEELNAFFVALTRAEHRAFFTLATDRGLPVRWVERMLDPVGVSRVAGEEAAVPQ